MSKGINLAEDGASIITDKILAEILPEEEKSKPCIFISHKKEDSPACKHLVWYLTESGINVFYDENDEILNDPIVRKDPVKLTNRITNALLNSTHMICVISEKTKNSWWVPFEIGYAWERDYMSHNDIKLLFLKDLIKPPEYFSLVDSIDKKEYLDNFIISIKQDSIVPLTEMSKIAGKHPLSNIMK
jgi:hypothetical protein